jgi:hypothetical protein
MSTYRINPAVKRQIAEAKKSQGNDRQGNTQALAKYNPNEVAVPNQKASWSQVKYWANIAGKFQQASLAAQVMAGFTLNELRKEFSKPGARTDLATSPNDSGRLGWKETCRKNCGISEDTARNWINMSEGIKSRWKKLAPQERIRELMRVPVSDWTDKDSTLICDALAKVTDGATQLEFMRELGLAKQVKGANSTGRLPGCDGTKTKLTISEEAALRKEQALVDWQGASKFIAAYRDKFVLLTDADVTAQIAVLEQALKARQVWLKQPADKREPAAIAKLLSILAF